MSWRKTRANSDFWKLCEETEEALDGMLIHYPCPQGHKRRNCKVINVDQTKVEQGNNGALVVLQIQSICLNCELEEDQS